MTLNVGLGGYTPTHTPCLGKHVNSAGGKVAPTHWIDECERAEEVTHPLSIHTITMVPEFTMEDIAQLQAEDTEIGDAYRVMQEGLDPSPDELRSFPLVTSARSQNGR